MHEVHKLDDKSAAQVRIQLQLVNQLRVQVTHLHAVRVVTARVATMYRFCLVCVCVCVCLSVCPPAYTCLSRCPATNALPPAAQAAWLWQAVRYMAKHPSERA